MVVLGIVAVHHPLLQLTPFADRGAHQPVPLFRQGLTVIHVHAQHLRGLDRVVEQIPDDLLVVGGTVLSRPFVQLPPGTMLRGKGVGRDQAAIRQFLEPV